MQIGADPEQLDELADRLKKEANQIDVATATITRSLQRIRWLGPDADEFRRRWAGVHRPMANGAVEVLRSMGSSAQANAREQRETSDSSGLAGAGILAGTGRTGDADAETLAAAAAVIAAARALVFGGSSGLAENPSGDPHVVSIDSVTVRGNVRLALGGGLGYGFRLEHLSDGTIRVTEIGEVRGEWSGGVGLAASGSWGSSTAHFGAEADVTAAATISGGASWIVKSSDDAQALIGRRLLASQPGATTAADLGTSASRFVMPRWLEDQTGVTAIHEAATFKLPKRDSTFEVLTGTVSAGARVGLGFGADVNAALSRAVGYEEDRHGNRTYFYEKSAGIGAAAQGLFLGPENAGHGAAQVSYRPSVTLDADGRPISITVVGEAGTGDVLHRRATTLDLTDPSLKASASQMVRGLTHPSEMDNATRDLIRSAEAATSVTDEKLRASSGSYGGAVSAAVIAKVGADLRVDVESFDVIERTVSGTGRRP